jgi:hypothetical protein
MQEHKNSMNKSDMRMYPYFFAMNFDAPDANNDWASLRITILKNLLKDFGVLPTEASSK